LIYFSAIAGVIHYVWLVKADIHKPLEYGAILAALLAYRVIMWQRRSSAARSSLATLPRKIAIG
jgi:methionine sulfoxide reductase heme-binding subunit